MVQEKHPPTEEIEMREAWKIACADAGIDTEAESLLLVVDGEPGETAFHLEPGSRATFQPGWALTAEHLVELNSTENRTKHRVLAKPIPDFRVALAKLRHELEHALQWNKDRNLYVFSIVSADALSVALYAQRPANARGGASLYNALPHEVDANQAAAVLSASVCGEPSEEEASGSFGVLFRDPQVPDRKSLWLRSVAFIAPFARHLDEAAKERDLDADAALDLLGEDGRQVWRSLVELPDVKAIAGRVFANIPSAVEVESAKPNSFAIPWRDCVSALRDGQIRTRESLEAILENRT